MRIALDANLLVLLIVGHRARKFVEKHKRLRQFNGDDFDLLKDVLDASDGVVATPNVLTEASNLVVYGVSEPLRSEFRQTLRELAGALLEHYQPSRIASEEPEFINLGLADCAWFGCLDSETVFITDDLDLFNAATSRGVVAYNFTLMRQERGLLP